MPSKSEISLQEQLERVAAREFAASEALKDELKFLAKVLPEGDYTFGKKKNLRTWHQGPHVLKISVAGYKHAITIVPLPNYITGQREAALAFFGKDAPALKAIAREALEKRESKTQPPLESALRFITDNLPKGSYKTRSSRTGALTRTWHMTDDGLFLKVAKRRDHLPVFPWQDLDTASSVAVNESLALDYRTLIEAAIEAVRDRGGSVSRARLEAPGTSPSLG